LEILGEEPNWEFPINLNWPFYYSSKVGPRFGKGGGISLIVFGGLDLNQTIGRGPGG